MGRDGQRTTRRGDRDVLVQRRSFDSIDAAFAFEEGEGDRSLAFWRATHETFFRGEGEFAPDMMLWSEHFRLVRCSTRYWLRRPIHTLLPSRRRAKS